MIRELVFWDGCPHCQDGIPAIVAVSIVDPYEEGVQYINCSPALIEALQTHGSMRIISCQKIDMGEEE